MLRKSRVAVSIVTLSVGCAGSSARAPGLGAPATEQRGSESTTRSARIIDRCTAESVRPGNAILRCQGFRLWLVRPLNERPEIVLERIRRTHADSNPSAELRASTFRVLGKQFTAVEYSLPNHQTARFGLVETSDGSPLVATCVFGATESASDRCASALEEVARDGFPEHALPASNKPELFDRELEFFDDCVLLGNNRVRCPNVVFHWGETPPSEEAEIADKMERGLERLGTVDRSHASCRMLDVPTECHVYRVTNVPFTVVLGVATTGGRTFFAQCTTTDPSLGPTPPPCDQVLRLDP